MANLQLPNSTSREIQKIWDELKKTGESPPQMVFSILGDSENFVPKPWPKLRFQNALVDAAKCAGECWLLFRNRAYVSDIVREAIQAHNSIKEDPMIQLLSVDDMIIGLAEKSEEDEILLSVELERFLTKHNIKLFGIKNHTLKIPVVEIVVEGGLKTMRHIALAIQNNIPVIIVKGSGKASDLIAEYLNTAPDQRENMVINTYPLLFGSTVSKNRKTTMLKALKDIRENHSMIHIFDIENDSRERLCELMGEAIVRAWAYEELKTEKPKTPKSKEDGLSLLYKSLNQPLTAAKVEALEPLSSHERYIIPTPGKTATSLPLYFYMGYQYIEEISEIPLKEEEVKQSKDTLLLEALRTNRTNYVEILLERLNGIPAILCDLYESTVLCKEEITCKVCKQWTNVTCKQLNKIDLPYRNGECSNSECWSCPDCYEKDLKRAELMRCHKHKKCRKCSSQEVEYMKECMNEDCKICKDCFTEHLLNKYVRRCKKHLSCEECRQQVSKRRRRCGCNRCDDCKMKLIPVQLCKECDDCKFCITPQRVEMDECKKCNRCSDCKKPSVVHYKFCPKCETCARCLEPECDDQHVLPKKCPHLGIYWVLQSICEDTTNQLLHSKEELLGLQPDFSIDTCEKYTSEMAQILCRMILGYELVGCSCSPFFCCCHLCHYPKSIGKNRIKVQEGENNVEKDKKKEDIYQIDDGGHKEFLQQLLLWSLIANRKDISGLVWKFVPNQLVTALISTNLLSKLAERAINVQQPSLGKELREHAQLFEKRSMAMLDGVYDMNAKEAMRLLDDEVKVWGIKTSAREFAYDNDMYDVIAHHCIQRKLIREWFDNDMPNSKYYFKGLLKGQTIKALSAPVAKFWYHYFLFTCMLVFFSAFILTSVDDTNYHFEVAKIWEFAVYLWAGMDLIEGVLSFWTFSFCPCDMKGFRRSSRSQKSVCYRMSKSLSDFWNIVDLLSYLLLIAAFLVRHFIPGDFTVPRKFFGISLLAFFIRYLQILMPFKKAGVTLILIKEMMKEMWYYLVVLFILLMSVGVYYHAIMYPSHLQIFGPGDFDTWSFWKIIYYPYFQIFGDLSLDYLEGTLASCSSNKTEWENSSSIERCPIDDWTVTAIAMAFLLIANLLIVNLIIAKFSSSFEEIQLKSMKQWRYERYNLVTEYSNRIPAPFNILRLLWPCINKCRKRKLIITDREARDEKNRRDYQDQVALLISI